VCRNLPLGAKWCFHLQPRHLALWQLAVTAPAAIAGSIHLVFLRATAARQLRPVGNRCGNGKSKRRQDMSPFSNASRFLVPWVRLWNSWLADARLDPCHALIWPQLWPHNPQTAKNHEKLLSHAISNRKSHPSKFMFWRATCFCEIWASFDSPRHLQRSAWSRLMAKWGAPMAQPMHMGWKWVQRAVLPVVWNS
jgi:hypothetical protein